MAEKEKVQGMTFAVGFPTEIKTAIFRAQNGKCKLCLKQMTDCHHRLENTATNRKLFPMYLNSIFNCVGLCRDCHTNKTHEPEIRKPLLSEVSEYESYLEGIKNGTR